MMDGVFADTAEPCTPLFPGEEGESKAPQERDKGWWTKPKQRSLVDGTNGQRNSSKIPPRPHVQGKSSTH